MSRADARLSTAAEPAWPVRAGSSGVVFLLDASSALEERLLRAWMQRTAPQGADARALRIPPSRRRSRAAIPSELEAIVATGEDPLLAPLRIAWLPTERDGERAVRLSDLLILSDPRDPGRLRQEIVLRRDPTRVRIVAGEPATVSELRARWSEAGGHTGATMSMAVFVVRQATLALERAERQLRGARYKVPTMVAEEILGRPAFRGELARIARELDMDEAAATRRAQANLREIAATHDPFVIDIVAHLIRKLYTQGYGERLQYDHEQLAGVATLSQRHPVVFLPTHKSNLDHLVLQYALHENGLPPNHTAGGINMNFFPVGPLVRRSGTFFIRRSFREDVLYKHVLRSYVDYLIEKRFSLEWYIEGGRSRSGKLLPPRFGMLAYVVDAYRRGKSDDVHLIPVSIAYDQIQDVRSYVKEQMGGVKEKEGFGWFLRLIRSLRRNYGKIHIRFGEPLSLASQLQQRDPGSPPDPDERELALQKLAFEVSVRINNATPITPTSLVTLAMLGTGDRALTVAQVRRGLANLLEYVQNRKLPTTAEFFQLESDDGIRRTLESLRENGVVSRFDGGLEPVYLIGPDRQLMAAYYRNTIIHFFVNPAIVELAVLHVGEHDGDDPLDTFFAECLRLRDLLKFEFFFADKERFEEEICDQLTYVDPDWESKLGEAEGPALLIRAFRPFTSHRTLRPFIEAYQVVSDQLGKQPEGAAFDEARFISECLGLGKQYRLQQHIQSASSVSKAIFQTALRLADNRGLLMSEAPGLAERRRAFAAEIRDVHRRILAVDALAASRRAGLIP